MHYPRIIRKYKLSRVQAGQHRQQPAVCLLYGFEDAGILIQRAFDYGVHIFNYYDRRAHVNGIYRSLPRRCYVDKALFFQYPECAFFHPPLLAGVIYHIGIIPCKELGKQLCKYGLPQISYGAVFAEIYSSDYSYGSRRSASDKGGDVLIPEGAQKVYAIQSAHSGSRNYSVLLHTVTEHHGVYVLSVQVGNNGIHVVTASLKLLLHPRNRSASSRLVFLQSDFLSLQDVLICGFPQIKAVFVYIVLCHRVYQVGNIPVHVDVFSYPRRADVLVVFFKGEIYDFARYGIMGGSLPASSRSAKALLLFLRSASENNVIEGMYGVLGRLPAVTGGILYYVASRHKEQFSALKEPFQQGQILRICNVYRNVVRENIHVFLVCNGHTEYFSSLQPGLGLLGPAELVKGQINLAAHIPDFPCDSLMAQTERVESARKESHRSRLGYVKFPYLQLISADKAIDMIEHGGIVEKSRFCLLHVFPQGHKLLTAMAVNYVFFPEVQIFRAENVHTEGPEGLLTYGGVIVGKASHHKINKLVLSVFRGLLSLLAAE